jgi:hypothetical protein
MRLGAKISELPLTEYGNPQMNNNSIHLMAQYDEFIKRKKNSTIQIFRLEGGRKIPRASTGRPSDIRSAVQNWKHPARNLTKTDFE